jgi:N utilization substance protein B
MHFSSIPPKVTINEYVELAKLYSTPKSKDFVNGVVDRLTKQLTKDGRIKKEGRGLVS